MLTRIGVVCMWVRDFPAMLSFYRDVLELPGSSVHPGPGYRPGLDWARFELQGTALELFAGSLSPKRAAGIPHPRANSTVLCFPVEEFDAVVEKLTARGVRFRARGAAEWGRYAHFRDPEGNDLQLYRPNPGC